MATNIEMNILQSAGTYKTLYPKTSTSNLEGTLSSSQLPSSIPASKISGTLSTSNIPNLSASKITSGILSVARGGTGNSTLAGLKNDLGIEDSIVNVSSTSFAFTSTEASYNFNGISGDKIIIIVFTSDTLGMDNLEKYIYFNDGTNILKADIYGKIIFFLNSYHNALAVGFIASYYYAYQRIDNKLVLLRFTNGTMKVHADISCNYTVKSYSFN